jgi:serine/threonine protein kinase
MQDHHRCGKSSPCPPREELEAFVGGDRPVADLAVLAAHIAECPLCESLLEAVSSQDPVLVSLRTTPIPDPFANEPECARMQARALALEPLTGLPNPSSDGAGWPNLRGFHIVRRAGVGTHGVVYQAIQYSSGRSVALKILQGSSNASRRRQQRLLSTTRVAARLTNSRVVPVLETRGYLGNLVVVTPFIDGTSLAAIVDHRREVKRGREISSLYAWAALAEAEYLKKAMTVLGEIVEAVAKLHQMEEPYADLKPENCLVDHDGFAWLTDLGLSPLVKHAPGVTIGKLNARDGDDPDVRVTACAYISPEEWAAKKGDKRSDVFRLGVLIYQVLTLELPFGLRPALPGRNMAAAPSSRHPLVTPSVDAVVLRALRLDPEARFASAVDLREEWQRSTG